VPDEEDAPATVPEWKPSELAMRIALGHAHGEHVPGVEPDDLARIV
jgi:hypothetical protein